MSPHLGLGVLHLDCLLLLGADTGRLGSLRRPAHHSQLDTSAEL